MSGGGPNNPWGYIERARRDNPLRFHEEESGFSDRHYGGLDDVDRSDDAESRHQEARASVQSNVAGPAAASRADAKEIFATAEFAYGLGNERSRNALVALLRSYGADASTAGFGGVTDGVLIMTEYGSVIARAPAQVVVVKQPTRLTVRIPGKADLIVEKRD